MSTRVVLQKNDVQVIKCKECEYSCRLNIQLKKHVEDKHSTFMRHKCDNCDFSSDLIANVWLHNLSEHQDKIHPSLSQDPSQLILKVNTERISSMLEEIEVIKKDTKNAFIELTKIVETNIEKIRVDNDEKCKTISNSMTKLNKKMTMVENSVLLTDYIDNHVKKKPKTNKETATTSENVPTEVRSCNEADGVVQNLMKLPKK